MRVSFLIMAVAAQAPTPVGPNPAFCADLRRIVAAADEEKPFASLPDDPDAERLGGLASCHRVTEGDDSFYCRVWTRGVPDGRLGLASRAQACLPGTVRREFDDPDSRNHWDRRVTRLRLGAVVVDVAEHGGPGVHIGWYYSIRVQSAGD